MAYSCGFERNKEEPSVLILWLKVQFFPSLKLSRYLSTNYSLPKTKFLYTNYYFSLLNIIRIYFSKASILLIYNYVIIEE